MRGGREEHFVKAGYSRSSPAYPELLAIHWYAQFYDTTRRHHIAVTWRSSDGETKLYDNGREVGRLSSTPCMQRLNALNAVNSTLPAAGSHPAVHTPTHNAGLVCDPGPGQAHPLGRHPRRGPGAGLRRRLLRQVRIAWQAAGGAAAPYSSLHNKTNIRQKSTQS